MILNIQQVSRITGKKILWYFVFLPFFYSVTTYAQAYRASVLKEIIDKSEASHSDALIIMQQNEVLYQNFYDNNDAPVYIASAGKSLTSLAIGRLLKMQLIDSLEQPVYTLFPEWKQGMKKDITIRMLLNHTSGLQNYANASIELEPPPTYKVQNIIQLALASELSHTPGKEVDYNNKAVALLGGIVTKASGKTFDRFFEDEFFTPMDIKSFEWIKDEEGNPTVHGAFVLKPSDLLKFGQLMLQKGTFNGHQLVDASWIEESFEPGNNEMPIWGLLWWRLPQFEKRIIDSETWESWEHVKVSEEFLVKIKPLKNILFTSRLAFYKALEQIFGAQWNTVLNENLPSTVASSKRIYSKNITAYYASGHRGNSLVIIPEHNIIAVRCAGPEGFNYQTDFFPDFVTLVSKLPK